VAALGTEAAIRPAPDFLADTAVAVGPASPAYQWQLGDGIAPNAEVQVSWQIPAEMQADPTPIAFIAQRADGTWEGSPVSVQNGVATAALTHEATFQFIRPQHIWQSLTGLRETIVGIATGEVSNGNDYLETLGVSSQVRDALIGAIGSNFTNPACPEEIQAELEFGTPLPAAFHHGRAWRAETTASGLLPCVEVIDGQIALSVHNYSPMAWLLTASPPAITGLQPKASADNFSSLVTAEVFRAQQQDTTAQQTLVVSGGTTSATLSPDSTAGTIQAKPAGSIALLPTLLDAIDLTMLLVTDTSLSVIMETNGVTAEMLAACIADNWPPDAPIDTQPTPDALHRTSTTIINCLSPALANADANIALAVFTSLLNHTEAEIQTLQTEVAAVIAATPTVTITSLEPMPSLEMLLTHWIRTGDAGGNLFVEWIMYRGDDWLPINALTDPHFAPMPAGRPEIMMVSVMPEEWVWAEAVTCRPFDGESHIAHVIAADWATPADIEWIRESTANRIAAGSTICQVATATGPEWYWDDQGFFRDDGPVSTVPVEWEFFPNPDGSWSLMEMHSG